MSTVEFYRTGMATDRKRSRRRGTSRPPSAGEQPPRFLRLGEHMAAKGFSDETLAQALNVSRVTVTRWRGERRALKPFQMKRIADKLGLSSGAELWELPGKADRPSIDAMIKNHSDEDAQWLAEVVADILKRDVSRGG